MAMGSEIAMISKGGTNQYHGDVFEYLRNSAINARNFFDGPEIPQLEKNNFGDSFGGPMRKDKTFSYVVYEGLQENLGFTANDLVPAAGCRSAAGQASQLRQEIKLEPIAERHACERFAILKKYPVTHEHAVGDCRATRSGYLI
jgi:hypothetical protein